MIGPDGLEYDYCGAQPGGQRYQRDGVNYSFVEGVLTGVVSGSVVVPADVVVMSDEVPGSARDFQSSSGVVMVVWSYWNSVSLKYVVHRSLVPDCFSSVPRRARVFLVVNGTIYKLEVL